MDVEFDFWARIVKFLSLCLQPIGPKPSCKVLPPLSPAALGVIEGASDGASTFAKLAGGRLADRVGVRHLAATFGYLITGLSTGSFALAQTWFELLIARTVGWMARGVRGPCRDNLLVESVPAEKVGTAFGFHRSFDTLGAVIGPLVAMFLLHRLGLRSIFVLSLIPGALSAGSFFFLVREPGRNHLETSRVFPGWKAAMPPAFRRFLLAVGAFGIGDFAHKSAHKQRAQRLR